MNHYIPTSLSFLFPHSLFEGYMALLLVMTLTNKVAILTKSRLCILKRNQIIKRYEHLKLHMPNWEID